MNNRLKRLLALLMCLILAVGCVSALAESDGVELTEDELTALMDATDDGSAQLSDEEEAELQALEDAMAELPDDEIDVSNLELNADLPDNVVNIALFGLDNRVVKKSDMASDVSERELALSAGRSDAVIICSLNLDTGDIKLSSVARDVMVVVPGYKDSLRINVAFYYGGKKYKDPAEQVTKGAALAMKTINRNFKLNVQKYVVVNIYGLSNIIDALGGVDLDMTKAEAKRINFELKKEPMDKVQRAPVEAKEGVQHLDGMQAVTFARIRGLDNDNERTSRQRKLLEALLEQVMNGMDLAKFTELIQTALPYGATNLTAAELVQYGSSVLTGKAMQNLGSGEGIFEQMRIPICKGDMVNGQTYKKNLYGFKNSMTYIKKDYFKQTVEELHKFIYGE